MPGLEVIAGAYRAERDSWKLDLHLAGGAQLELFSFPSPPPRVSRPEACGLRHLAFRVDGHTGRRSTFFADPDGLPLERYEA